MPIVDIAMATGRNPEQIRELLHRVHAAVRDALDVPDSSIRVLITEIPATHWSSGGSTLAEKQD